MYDQDGVDPYVDPATGVFINLLGITDATLLTAAEAGLVYLRTAELATRDPLGNFDLSHLQAIHAYLFGDVYPWAGRSVGWTLEQGYIVTVMGAPRHPLAEGATRSERRTRRGRPAPKR